MSALASVVEEIEEVIGSGDARRRIETLRRVTSLFIDQSPALQEAHVDAFDDVIFCLASNIEFRARVELSERLAEIANAPRKVVKSLALDEIAVAAPVLQRSQRLDEADLLDVASRKGQEHLLAISRRPELTPPVADTLVDRGNAEVVRSVAQNRGACFSSGGYARLVAKAQADEGLQEALEARSDLATRDMQALVAIARERIREALKNELRGEAGPAVDEVVDRVAADLSRDAESSGAVERFAASAERIGREALARKLSESDLVEWLKSNLIEDAIAGMAQLANLPLALAVRAFHAPTYDPLLFIARANAWSWPTFKLLLSHKAGRMPPQALLQTAFDHFQQLSAATAQRVVRFALAHDRTRGSLAQ